MLAVLHDLGLALAADRVLVMNQGRLRADGPPSDAQLQATLMEVFDGAFAIEPVGAQGDRLRWMAVPRL